MGDERRVVIVIKHNRYARHQACSICDADRSLCIGPCLFEDGDWQGVCDDCAREHAPGLLAMLECPQAQKAYWLAEQARAEQRQVEQVGDTLSSLEAELGALHRRVAETQARIEEMRREGL